MIIGLILGIGVGLNIGLWIGTYVTKKWTQPLIEDYKKSNKYWFDSFMEANQQRHEWYCKYLSQVIK